jgi:hypothetical protein
MQIKNVRGPVRPVQAEQRESGRVGKRTAGIEVGAAAMGASRLFPGDFVMLGVVTRISAPELFDESP